MRIGYNPYKDQPLAPSEFLHQIVIPVYIPHFEGYFKDSFAVFKLCLQSVFATTHDKTFITIINNGSCDAIKEYLNGLLHENKIHEVIHTHNIGKLNAILKGLAGSNIELVTISDADVLFLNGWQTETTTIFSTMPRVGVVGIVPQFNLHKVHSSNLIWDNLFGSKLQFLPVKNREALSKFYDSIGWDKNYNHDYLAYSLGLKWTDDLTVLVGSGHFVATYKKDIFENTVGYFPFKMGGYTEDYLDVIPLKRDYWRVSTYDNFAYHIGNSVEDWMLECNTETGSPTSVASYFSKNEPLSKIHYFFKIKLLQFVYRQKWVYKLFLRWKKLPASMIKNY